MSRRAPKRPKTQQRHRTKPTVQAAPPVRERPRETVTENDRPDFYVAGKRYRWMRAASGEWTAVQAPEPARAFRRSLVAGGRRAGKTARLSGATHTGPPIVVEFPNAAAAKLANASPEIIAQAAEYDRLLTKTMSRTGLTREQVLQAFNFVEARA